MTKNRTAIKILFIAQCNHHLIIILSNHNVMPRPTSPACANCEAMPQGWVHSTHKKFYVWQKTHYNYSNLRYAPAGIVLEPIRLRSGF